MRDLPRETLLDQAFSRLSNATLRALFNISEIDVLRITRVALTSKSQNTKKLFRRIADTLYFNQGKTYCLQERWNEMTKLQLENELLMRGMVDELEEKPSELKLRIILAAAAVKEKEKKRVRLAEREKLWKAYHSFASR
ncbi:hypothetical protein GMOD_00006804 [Pyrenophora seminiperda CCB06]|uniref:Uncharacterized protein n=1 Tax=Pyrenophora seminiperda CCB06 TaxID=1302712 RepID=A0A3M7MBC8_9PLEO|nr:hypothetical protein GMOD_00006804 [Pyrenophora seminiperda CCB06]